MRQQSFATVTKSRIGQQRSQLYRKLYEGHMEEYCGRVAQYFTACEPSSRLSVSMPSFAAPPPFTHLPKPEWLLSVYVRDVLLRHDEVKKITSIYGSI